MLTSSQLVELLGSDDVVAFTEAGDRIAVPAGLPDASAAMVVSAVSDALKKVSVRGFIEGSVDRSDVWSANAFVLSREVVERLEGDFPRPVDLYEAVAALGFEWTVSPTSSSP